VKKNNLIRRANKQDIEAIFLIEKNAFQINYWSKDMIEQGLSNNKIYSTFVSEYGGIIIGFCMVQIIFDEVNVVNMAISPRFQGLGYGKMLMEFLLGEIPINSSVFLEVKESNMIAIELYSNLGFEKIGMRASYYQDGSNALIMCFKK
tara:strand:- start:270 stop:713 length:444 start_codon:yes stop_codon:yes gene_type:complete